MLDMESAQRPKPKAPSPSGSASQKNISITLRSMPLADAKEVATGSVVMPSQQTPQSLSGPAGASQKRHEPLEHTAESISRQELGSQGEVLGSQSMLQIDEEVQQQPFNDAGKECLSDIPMNLVYGFKFCNSKRVSLLFLSSCSEEKET